MTNLSSNNGKRTVPDVLTEFQYVLEIYLVCVATFVTCCKSDVSVVIFDSCLVVVRAGGGNKTSRADSKARSAIWFGARRAAMQAFFMYLYCITLLCHDR